MLARKKLKFLGRSADSRPLSLSAYRTYCSLADSVRLAFRWPALAVGKLHRTPGDSASESGEHLGTRELPGGPVFSLHYSPNDTARSQVIGRGGLLPWGAYRAPISTDFRFQSNTAD